MTCPKCGSTMTEISKWQRAPFGGWKCSNCGLEIDKKTSSKVEFTVKFTLK